MSYHAIYLQTRRTYRAHHELESDFIIITVNGISCSNGLHHLVLKQAHAVSHLVSLVLLLS